MKESLSPATGPRRALAGAAFLALVLSLGAGVIPASAHEAQCPVCKLDVPQDTEQQDNEVALRSGRKRIEYRCVLCAVTDARSFNGDLTVLAPSELRGRPVLISRASGSWSVLPATAIFVGQKAPHKDCPVTYRAFTSRAAFDAYVKKHADLLSQAPPLTLPQLLEQAK